MRITNDVFYVGVNDYGIKIFEGQYPVKNGMSYNSYVIIDEKIAIMDSVAYDFKNEWLANIEKVLNGRNPNYLIVQHMEPDHSANIMSLIEKYPDCLVVASKMAINMMKNFFNLIDFNNILIVGESDKLSLGKHELQFIAAPMVHWPEVMVTYDSFDKILFSADGFGKFGNLDTVEEWEDEARRYYFGIVGKYGDFVLKLLNKASNYDIKTICPLHGPVLRDNLSHYLQLYTKWATYEPKEGILIVYSSIYGNTKTAALNLFDIIKNKGYENVVILDANETDVSYLISMAFKYKKLIIATTTYNNGIFPTIRNFINSLVERNFQNRIVGFIQNGSWAPAATKVMTSMLAESKQIQYLTNNVTINSSLHDSSKLELLAQEVINS